MKHVSTGIAFVSLFVFFGKMCSSCAVPIEQPQHLDADGGMRAVCFSQGLAYVYTDRGDEWCGGYITDENPKPTDPRP